MDYARNVLISRWRICHFHIAGATAAPVDSLLTGLLKVCPASRSMYYCHSRADLAGSYARNVSEGRGPVLANTASYNSE